MNKCVSDMHPLQWSQIKWWMGMLLWEHPIKLKTLFSHPPCTYHIWWTSGLGTENQPGCFHQLTDLLKEFDELCSTLKEARKTRGNPKNIKDEVERCKVLLANISLQPLAKRTQLDNAVKKFEQQYFVKHGQLPKCDPSYNGLINSCKGRASNTER